MASRSTLSLLAAAALGLATVGAQAQTPPTGADHSAHHPPASSSPGSQTTNPAVPAPGMAQGGMQRGGMGMGMGCPMMGAGDGKPGMMMGGASMEERMAALKGDLKITAAQESSWTGFVAAAKAAGEGMHHGDMKMPASAVDRFAMHQSMMERHVAAQKKVSDAFGSLYAALTPDQKTIADQRVMPGHMGAM